MNVVAIAACAAGLLNQFTQDDLGLIVKNDRIHGLAHLRDILTAPYWPPPYIPTGILVAERTLFSPSLGFLLALGGVAAHLSERWRGHHRVVVAACGLLVLAATVRSALRHRIYRDASTLTSASLADSPRSWRVRHSYAEGRFDLGRTEEARRAYQEAIRLSPEPRYLRTSLAVRLRLAVGKYEEAPRIADGIIASAGAPPIMVWLRRLADSAIAVGAPPGSIRIGIKTR